MLQIRKLFFQALLCLLVTKHPKQRYTVNEPFLFNHAMALLHRSTFMGQKFILCVCFSGYLAVSLFLNENHELLLLLVNTVLKVGDCVYTAFVKCGLKKEC